MMLCTFALLRDGVKVGEGCLLANGYVVAAAPPSIEFHGYRGLGDWLKEPCLSGILPREVAER